MVSNLTWTDLKTIDIITEKVLQIDSNVSWQGDIGDNGIGTHDIDRDVTQCRRSQMSSSRQYKKSIRVSKK